MSKLSCAGCKLEFTTGKCCYCSRNIAFSDRYEPTPPKLPLTKKPWASSYYGARTRCKKGGGYYPRIKFLMTEEDFDYLWERDNGAGLEYPSIDRIDNKKDYTRDNCQFIELSLNCAKDQEPHSEEVKKKISLSRKRYLATNAGKLDVKRLKRNSDGSFRSHSDYLTCKEKEGMK